MKEIITKAVEDIFKNYEETSQLKDFQEEITINLLERVGDLMKKGLTENEAIGKALIELGDITEIADSIGKQKRKETIEDYFGFNKPLAKRHALGFAISIAVLIISVLICALLGFTGSNIGSSLILFITLGVPAIGALVCFCLTIETAVNYPMEKKRALLFALGVWLIVTGVFIGIIISFWQTKYSDISFTSIDWLKTEYISNTLIISIVILIIFVVAGIALLCYLALTQENLMKPWVLKKYMGKYGEKFGLISGFVWILAIALFFLLGFLIGWHISWTVFLFAVAAEILVLLLVDESKENLNKKEKEKK